MSPLFEPVLFRNGARSRNRVALAALTNMQSHADGSLSEAELGFLARRAEGGFGIVTTCAAHVTADGQGWPGELGVHDDALLPGLSRLAQVLAAEGALALVQLFHGGLRADSKVTHEQTWSASAADAPEPASGHRAATAADIARVISAFGEAGRRAADAGMGGVEIHGAHGYLLSQFLSRVDNRRTDTWGGSAAGRARLMREVVREVRGRVPEQFVVGVRLSPEDVGNARGLDLDENVDLARDLAEDGVDFIHLSLWNAFRNSTKYPDRHPVELFRRAVPGGVRLFAAGKVWTRADAERLLALGTDVVALGRAAIANPEWPRASEDPDWRPRTPPLTPRELGERALAPGFVEYMRTWKGFVGETPPVDTATA